MIKWDTSKHPRDKHGRFKDEGLITHEGKLYNVSKLIKITRKKKVYQQPLSQLKESLEETLNKDDYKRIEVVKDYLHLPILIAKTKNRKSGIVNVDGFHRIHKANQLGMTHLPAIKVNKKDLEKAQIKKFVLRNAAIEYLGNQYSGIEGVKVHNK